TELELGGLDLDRLRHAFVREWIIDDRINRGDLAQLQQELSRVGFPARQTIARDDVPALGVDLQAREGEILLDLVLERGPGAANATRRDAAARETVRRLQQLDVFGRQFEFARGIPAWRDRNHAQVALHLRFRNVENL